RLGQIRKLTPRFPAPAGCSRAPHRSLLICTTYDIYRRCMCVSRRLLIDIERVTTVPEGGPNVEDKLPVTMTIPAAGRHFYDLGRDGSYAAARRGDLVTIRVGRLRRVPVEAQKARMAELTRAGDK